MGSCSDVRVLRGNYRLNGLGAVVGHVATVCLLGDSAQVDDVNVFSTIASLHGVPYGPINCYTGANIAPHGRHPQVTVAEPVFPAMIGGQRSFRYPGVNHEPPDIDE